MGGLQDTKRNEDRRGYVMRYADVFRNRKSVKNRRTVPGPWGDVSGVIMVNFVVVGFWICPMPSEGSVARRGPALDDYVS